MRKIALSMLAATIMMIVGAAAQTEYPTHPIRLIVPFAPGGSTDSQARVLADFLGRALGQQVVVVNVGGAGGTIGLNQGAKATPDGYTLVTATPSMTINPYIQKNIPYDPIKDFEPIALVATSPIVLVVPKDFEDQDRARLDRDGQGQAGANPLRQRRHRIGDAFELGAVRDDGGCQPRARALSRRLARPSRPDS